MALPAPAASPSRRSRRNLTYREKLAIIQKKEDEPTCTQRNLAVWAMDTFGLESKPTQATISNLLRGKDKLMNAVVPLEFRSARRVKHPELDRMVLRWVRMELQGGRCMTRSAVQSKAMELAHEMQLPLNVSFSKGWISCFMKRHELNFSRKKGEQVARAKDRRTDTTAGVNRVEQVQAQQVEESEDEEEDEEETVETKGEEVKDDRDNGDVKALPVSIVADDSTPIQSVKRRRVDDRGREGGGKSCQLTSNDENATTNELLLDWIAVPGSYSRWWLLTGDEEKESLYEEINLFLRSHGERGMNRVDIRQQLSTFRTTFLAAHTWLRQTKVAYPPNDAALSTEERDIRRHVVQMCPHYERLVTVLAPYVNYDDNTANAKHTNEGPATATVEPVASLQIDRLSCIQARDPSITNWEFARPNEGLNSRQQRTDSIREDSIDDETKAQKRHLFELECTRLQSEIETRNIKLVLEKTLARKKLLDAGISSEEVDRIFPLVFNFACSEVGVEYSQVSKAWYTEILRILDIVTSQSLAL